MYISDKRIKHEISKIENRRSKQDIPKLDLLEEIEAISYDEYTRLLNLIESKEVEKADDIIRLSTPCSKLPYTRR